MNTSKATMFATAALLTGLVIPLAAQEAVRGIQKRGGGVIDRTQDDPGEHRISNGTTAKKSRDMKTLRSVCRTSTEN